MQYILENVSEQNVDFSCEYFMNHLIIRKEEYSDPVFTVVKVKILQKIWVIGANNKSFYC